MEVVSSLYFSIYQLKSFIVQCLIVSMSEAASSLQIILLSNAPSLIRLITLVAAITVDKFDKRPNYAQTNMNGLSLVLAAV